VPNHIRTLGQYFNYVVVNASAHRLHGEQPWQHRNSCKIAATHRTASQKPDQCATWVTHYIPNQRTFQTLPKIVWHTGNLQGFSNVLAILPDERFAVAIMKNMERADPVDIANELLESFAGVTTASPKKPESP